MQLILSKINIPDESPRLSRPRLLNTLHGSLSACTSTIVNGRTGTGKTMLAADFARRCGRRIAWYKVDASDANLRVFFQYLIESVRRQRPGFGQETLVPLVQTATIEDMPVLAEAFVFELLESKGSGDPLLIVIDDLHLVYDAEWVVPFFRRLLPLLPAEAHMLITGRSMPPAPLWRMRSKQMLCVIEEPTLAFTQQEASKLFESYGLSEAHASIALKHSRGRAVVIDRFAVVLGSNGKAVADSFLSTERRLRKPRVRQLHGHSY
jgi:LuxR family maltose regulon positive regulatory protein